MYLGFSHLQLGHFDDARAVFENDRAYTELVNAHDGRRDRVQRAMSELSHGDRCDHTTLALLCVSLGECTRAIDELRTAVERHEASYLNICPRVEPLLDALRSSAEFSALPLAS